MRTESVWVGFVAFLWVVVLLVAADTCTVWAGERAVLEGTEEEPLELETAERIQDVPEGTFGEVSTDREE